VPVLDRYLVELHRPAGGWHDLPEVTARARAAAQELRSEGAPVRFLRSVYVPEDETCFFVFEGPSAEAVGEAGRRAAIEIGCITEALTVGADRATERKER
jgi:uncharacterized protein DUF4242